MDFMTAIKTVLTKNYANFKGRSRRSEYWWFYLFYMAMSGLLGSLSQSSTIFAFISLAFSLGMLIPSIAVGVRRLHDINKSGWFLLFGLIPILGWIYIIILLAKRGSTEENRFGPPVI